MQNGLNVLGIVHWSGEQIPELAVAPLSIHFLACERKASFWSRDLNCVTDNPRTVGNASRNIPSSPRTAGATQRTVTLETSQLYCTFHCPDCARF